MGNTAAMTVVITAELPQSYIAQARSSGLPSPTRSRRGAFRMSVMGRHDGQSRTGAPGCFRVNSLPVPPGWKYQSRGSPLGTRAGTRWLRSCARSSVKADMNSVTGPTTSSPNDTPSMIGLRVAMIASKLWVRT
jgi:hypothetical protein